MRRSPRPGPARHAPGMAARCGAPCTGAGRSDGFTLVEMLIALTIFGMLTAAGVALLTLTVRTQATSERLLDQVGELRRAGALLTADLGQAAPRLSRDRDGRPRPAFLGAAGDGELLLALVRGGSDEEPLQRVEYRLRDGRLLVEMRCILEDLFGEKPARDAVNKYTGQHDGDNKSGKMSHILRTGSIPALGSAARPAAARTTPKSSPWGD